MDIDTDRPVSQRVIIEIGIDVSVVLCAVPGLETL